jgi:lipopolysaccharide export system permease protein
MSLTALASLVLLMIISELFGDLTIFAEYNTSIPTIMQFLGLSIPRMIDLVLPFSVCLGILAAQASFARNSETIAMQACSIPLAKIYIPYLLVGLLATGLMASTSFYLYPMAQKEANKIQSLTIKKGDVSGSFTVTGGKFKVGQDVYSVDNLDVNKGTMDNITCYRFKRGRLSEIDRAESARWDGGRWVAKDMKIITLNENGISSPKPAPYLPLTKEPEALVTAQTDTEVLPLPELREYLMQLRSSGTSSPTIETLYYSRISFALAPFIITLLVVPFGMRFPRAGGIAKGITVGLILGLSYWFLHSGMTGLGTSGVLPPLIASWGANLAALGLAVIILFKKRRAVYG